MQPPSDLRTALGVSLFIHLLIVGLFTLNIGSHPAPQRAASNPAPIQATAIAAEQLEQQLDQLRDNVAESKARAEHQREAEQKRQAEVKRKAEEKRQAEVKRKAEETKRLALEAKKRAEEKQKFKEEEERRVRAEAEQKAQEEAKEKAEMERKKQADAKAKKEKAEAERLAQEKEQRRIEAQRELQAKMAAEEERRQAEADAKAAKQHSREQQRALEIYKHDIAMRVSSNWTRPPGFDRIENCSVVVHQSPNGEVSNVVATDCARLGGVALQHSVESAVRKASPLPLPEDPSLFDAEIVFYFKTE